MSEEKKDGSYVALGSLLLVAGLAAFGAEAMERRERNQQRLKEIEDERRETARREHEEFLARTKREADELEAALRLKQARERSVDQKLEETVARLGEQSKAQTQRIYDDFSQLMRSLGDALEKRLEDTERKIELAQHGVPYPFKKEESGN